MYFLKQYRNTAAIGLMGIIVSITASIVVYQAEVSKSRDRFEQQSTVLVGTLQNQLDGYVQLTRSMGAFLRARSRVNQTEFQEFSQTLLPYYDGLLGLGWVSQVKAGERQSYEEQFFPIKEWDDTGNFIAAGDRDVYFPTTHLEPLEQWENYLGWDASSDPKRLLSLEKAKYSGVSVSTPLVTLESGNPGFVLYYPVLSSDETFEGAVFSVYELQSWVETAIANLDLNNINFYIYELPEDQLDSALNKTSVTATEGFLIAYKNRDGKLTQSVADARLENLENGLSQCPYNSQWQSCIRSIAIARQEFSLLVLPTAGYSLALVRAGTVLLFSLLATGSLVMYLAIANWTKLNLESKNQQLETLLQELQQSQLQLIQTEKMSSLGRLVAGVAHEINNPVNFISGNLEYAQTYFREILSLVDLYQKEYPQPKESIAIAIEDIELDFLAKDLPDLLDSMQLGTERLRTIVLSLRNFSRLDESEVKDVDIHLGIDNTLVILNSRLTCQGNRREIKIVKEYGDLPLIECCAGQINQVFMNILGNAIDALEEFILSTPETIIEPAIVIKTAQAGENWITIQISDNGPGIPEEIQSRLFDPFFTTKPIGKGTGLGLSISYQVITEKHGGTLVCSSTINEGTMFTIGLPIVRSKEMLSVREISFAEGVSVAPKVA
ncbi:CHASE domain-containing protein [Roseofilum casamattae]|uniref:histidine kinase n=1 Tax=Roseofilum casamattae BLCC-M143 TaxID=3022442 RepID=A0ABT7BUQ4_9CYAN|nr:CHASE domain-containing protein [Roseofilum casamattae]MDJ1182003.1 CHASE domain-containing protein [Roseofilum casamattae BLCC-M143]